MRLQRQQICSAFAAAAEAGVEAIPGAVLLLEAEAGSMRCDAMQNDRK